MPDIELTPNFKISEFKCHDGTGVPFDLVDNVRELAKNLQALRDELGGPIRIISGYRNPTYNKKIGGADRSKHMQGIAADMKASSHTPEEIHAVIEKLIADGRMKQGGLGLYPGRFVHYDTRGTRARWKG